MADIELTGVDEILNKLQWMSTNISRLENKALKNAAESVLEDAKANALVRTGKLKKVLR
ncbi:HK97 gp10 family phage protein [Clostridium kluyveri]|uniref:HK97 gp10 family phage protein n=1 Tax=Clostridium kluyveri TaxID=1534 RepID=UPI000AEF5FBD|nr:HK97 gp10 family phage protein [Clostridium kluyveri]